MMDWRDQEKMVGLLMVMIRFKIATYDNMDGVRYSDFLRRVARFSNAWGRYGSDDKSI